jgi:hypothetical protein
MDEGGSCGGAFDQGGDIGWKLFGPPECALDALDLESAGGQLAGGSPVRSPSTSERRWLISIRWKIGAALFCGWGWVQPRQTRPREQ